MEVNEKCDVYSFGVLAIQTPFGEYHEDFITSLLTSSSNFIDSTLDIPSLMGKLDQRLPYPPNPIAKEIVLTVRIANACLIENPILALPWSKLAYTCALLLQEFDNVLVSLKGQSANARCKKAIESRGGIRKGNGSVKLERKLLVEVNPLRVSDTDV
ncbi:hypothetical protein JHK85_025445 [Glycine max]|nr:hypothetical protein JHK85_025445 [Glycine max]